MSQFQAFNFKQWIDKNRSLLKPPVGNKCVFKDGTFFVMVVGGANERTDFHINQTDEFFHQIEGDMFLRIITKERKVDEIHIRAGDIFMLPGGVPHSPQRAEGSIGMVVELTRPEGSQDALQWYCAKCQHKLYEEYFHLTDVETQFGPVYERYFSGGHCKCSACGHENGKIWNP